MLGGGGGVSPYKAHHDPCHVLIHGIMGYCSSYRYTPSWRIKFDYPQESLLDFSSNQLNITPNHPQESLKKIAQITVLVCNPLLNYLHDCQTALYVMHAPIPIHTILSHIMTHSPGPSGSCFTGWLAISM